MPLVFNIFPILPIVVVLPTPLTPEIKIATPYFKPNKNQTDRKPDFFIHETDQWLIFPHELEGLTFEDIKENKPELKNLIKQIKSKI